MKKTQDAAALAGRIMLALMFVISGLGKIGAFADTTVYMASAGLPAIDPLLEILLIVTILVELGGGTAIIFGWKTRQATVVIFLFTALVTVVFHRFWDAPPDQAIAQQLMFMKNVAVMGGLLVLWAFGPGEYALDDTYRRGARKHLPAGTAGSW
jgi:putative oxidoreductase